MKCIDCEFMKVVSIEDGTGAAAKCFKTSKRGKSIVWAMTAYSPKDNWKESKGEDRVNIALEKKIKAPHWCPLR